VNSPIFIFRPDPSFDPITPPFMNVLPNLRLFSLLAFGLILGNGCTTTRSHPEPGVAKFASTDGARVQLIPWASHRPHEKVGEIIIEPSKGASWQEIDQELRQAAADLGAHAMYVVWDPQKRFSSVQVDPIASDQQPTFPPNSIVAVAIRFK